MRLFYAYTLLLSLVFFATACGSDEPPAENKPDYPLLIIGDWQMNRGLQDGVLSDRFDEFSLRFTEDSMESLLLESIAGAKSAVYAIEARRIVLTAYPGVDFTIKELNNDSLRIAFEVEESQFDFLLNKKRAEQKSLNVTEATGAEKDSIASKQEIPQ